MDSPSLEKQRISVCFLSGVWASADSSWIPEPKVSILPALGKGWQYFPLLRTPFPVLLFNVHSPPPPPDVNLKTTRRFQRRAPNPSPCFPWNELLTAPIRCAFTAGAGGEMGRMQEDFPESWIQVGSRLIWFRVERSLVIRGEEQAMLTADSPEKVVFLTHLVRHYPVHSSL